MTEHYTIPKVGPSVKSLPMKASMPVAVVRPVIGALFCLSAVLGFGQASNDLCVNSGAANQFPVGTTCTPLAFVKPTAYNPNYNPGTCGATANDDAFGWFVATSTNTIITYQPPGVLDAILHVFSGTCAAPVEVACSNAGAGGVAETLTLVTTIGTSYFFRVQRSASNNAMDGTICIYSPTPPTNDNPCTATSLTVGTTCGFSGSTTSGATSSPGLPAVSCSNYLGGDVWFSAVVPANGRLIFDTNTGVITDGGMALYTATACNGTFTEIECDDDDSGNGLMPFIDRSGLTPGATVYIRFWEYGGNNNGTFSICARTPPPPPTGDCVYALNLFDTFGDGWGTSNVGVRINGGAITYYTVGGSANQVLLGMNIGDFIELFYDNSGAFQFENSYTLGLLNGGTYFNSGSPPVAGNAFSQIVNCEAPPTAPQDCNGGFTLCNAQSFVNNSGNSGNIVDLNTTNQGCLSLGERQGTWYYFSPSAGGTVAFTINPATDVDYDFAVWGPPTMGSITCPPTTAPIRCSWASGGSTFSQTGSYDTGLRPEGDVTEGAGGNGWVNQLTVVAGQQYILYVDNFETSNEPFELTWQLSGGASLDCTVLPIGLVDLKAEAIGLEVGLTWSTLSESNSDRFVIERSADNIAFERIGGLDAMGNSANVTDYRFTDRRPFPGVNFYRVSLLDLDGTEVRSPVVQAFVDPRGNQPIIVPNPAKELAYITLKDGLDSGVEVRLSDASGRLVRTVLLSVPEGTTRVELPLVGIDAGMYSIGIVRKDGSVIGYTNFVKE